jgi:putative hemolysin
VIPNPFQLGLVLSAAAGFLLAWAAYSLRDFSRSKLDLLCRNRDRADRFGEILKHHEPTLRAVELAALANLVLLLSLVGRLIRSWSVGIEGTGDRIALILEVGGVAVLMVLLLLVIPWSLSRVRGESAIVRLWPLLGLLRAAARPYLVALKRFDAMLHRLTGIEEPNPGDVSVLSEEILSVVDAGQREGLIEREARTMIHRVIELQEVDVSSIMTPRTEIVSLPITSTLHEARAVMIEEGHSRVPAIGENNDDIIGILYAKDLLRQYDEETPAPSLKELIREPLYVPETTAVDDLLQTMKSERVQIAIVLDEYGGVSGLVTMEDILEEIVGDIDDEYDEIEEEGIQVLDDQSLLVDGRIHLDELNERFEYVLPEEGDYDTIAGFVVSELGRIPQVGEALTWKQYRITVVEADKRRITKVQLDVDPSLQEVTSEDFG